MLELFNFRIDFQIIFVCGVDKRKKKIFFKMALMQSSAGFYLQRLLRIAKALRALSILFFATKKTGDSGTMNRIKIVTSVIPAAIKLTSLKFV